MQRFISRKKIKVPRYKILLVKLGVLLVILCGSVMLLKRTTAILNNSYDFLFKELGLENNNIWSYVLGINLDNTTSVFKEDIIINKPLVYIYNTYQTLKYKLEFYSSYSINPVITNSNLILNEYLKKEGITSVIESNSVVKTLKDNNLSYEDSYKGSKILLLEAVKQNSSLKYFLDMQISSKEYNETTIEYNNNKYAKIEFIIGTDNNNYSDNIKVWEMLNNKLNSKIEGISKIVTTNGVFNEDYSSRVIVLNVGGKENTTLEVNNTLEVFAKVFGEYIKEEQK